MDASGAHARENRTQKTNDPSALPGGLPRSWSEADQQALARAVRHLQDGGCLLYPTETFYALGCDACQDRAVAAIYQLKQRTATKPLPLIAASLDMAAAFCDLSAIPEQLLSLWPGPLTLVVPIRRPFPAPLVDSLGRVALRVSAHPVARLLSERAASPLAATSANVQHETPVTRAGQLDPRLCARAMVLDLPPAPAGGAASTIVSVLAGGSVCIHREGPITAARLRELGLRIEA